MVLHFFYFFDMFEKILKQTVIIIDIHEMNFPLIKPSNEFSNNFFKYCTKQQIGGTNRDMDKKYYVDIFYPNHMLHVVSHGDREYYFCCILKNMLISGDFEPLYLLLSHQSAAVRSRICSLIGNLLKHNNHFYSTIKQKQVIFGYYQYSISKKMFITGKPVSKKTVYRVL